MEKELERYKRESKVWQKISLWLRIREIPLFQYDSLPDKLKELLHSCIGISDKPVTARQRDEVFKALMHNVVAGRDSEGLNSIFSDEVREHFMSPLTSDEEKEYMSNYPEVKFPY